MGSKAIDEPGVQTFSLMILGPLPPSPQVHHFAQLIYISKLHCYSNCKLRNTAKVSTTCSSRSSSCSSSNLVFYTQSTIALISG